MNAVLIISVSTLILGAVFFIFFVLAGQAGYGADDTFHGTLTASLQPPDEEVYEGDPEPQSHGIEDSLSIHYKFAQDGDTGDKVYQADFEAAQIRVLNSFDAASERLSTWVWDYDTGALLDCRQNTQTDQMTIDSFFTTYVDGAIKIGATQVTADVGDDDEIDYDTEREEGEEGFVEPAVTWDVEYNFNDGAAEEGYFMNAPSEEVCEEVIAANSARKLQESVDAGLTGTEHMMTKYKTDDRNLANAQMTSYANLATDVYGNSATCYDSTQDWWGVGELAGEACWQASGCNIAFRGSVDNSDWASNFHSALKTENSARGTPFGAGFLYQFNVIKANSAYQNVVNACSNPVFIGHSLGGAMAVIAREDAGKGIVHTFAGARAYKNNVGCSLGGRRVWHESDPVPSVPFDSWHANEYSTKLYEKGEVNISCGSCRWCRCCWCETKRAARRATCWASKVQSGAACTHVSTKADNNSPGGCQASANVALGIVRNILNVFGSNAADATHFHSMGTYYNERAVSHYSN